MSDIFEQKYPIYINDIYISDIQGGSKKVSCCTVSTAYFFEPPCISSHPDYVLYNEPDDHHTLPLSPKGGSPIGRFRCKIALCLIHVVCYKVSFCENCRQQSNIH